MTLTEIKPMNGKHLYDRDGNCVGKWHGERGIIAGCFVVRERTCCNMYHDHGDRSFRCSACGYEAWTYGDSQCEPDEFVFCPSCGARVVSE